MFLGSMVGKNYRITLALHRLKIIGQLIDQGVALLAEGTGIVYFLQKGGVGCCHCRIGCGFINSRASLGVEANAQALNFFSTVILIT